MMASTRFLLALLTAVLLTTVALCEVRADATLESRWLRVSVVSETGSIAVTDKRIGRVWAQPPPAGRHDRQPFRQVVEANGRIRFITSAGGADLQVTLSLSQERPELVVDTDVAERGAPFGGALSLDAFLPQTPEAYLAVADYCDGHLYPLRTDPFPRRWMAADRLDMPWFGVADTLTGPGYAAIIATSDDACVDMQRATVGAVELWVPRIGWLPSRKTFAYPRKAIFCFTDRGGYVALARAYRAYAQRTGLLRTLAEKARRNPNVRRLYGAVDMWGDASLTFAREAHEAGVRRMLIHGKPTAAEMRAVNALGYLTSDYDNYTDILPVEPGKTPDSTHDVLPDAAVMNADGSRMTAWLTYDKKTQYMKRCPSLWVSRARSVIGDVLKRLPYLGRFIDVTTAEALYECHDPAHPLSRTDKRVCGERLLAAVEEFGLVVGGEHGIWWGVPHLHYIEGMMSSYQFAWPAGHLIRPRDREEKFEGPYGTDTWENYEKWGLGHAHRVPLWQLVFHDCVVSTWYWGDSNDFLLRAAPEFTGKKDAYNVLYGTMPMMWANRDGAWHADRRMFLRTAQIATAVHATTAESEMTEHAFVTPDRSVQRTRFANGTMCIVNFGATKRRVTLAGGTHVLPQNGFAVSGPGLRMFRRITDGRVVTTVNRPGHMYREDDRTAVIAWAEGKGVVKVVVHGSGKSALAVADLVKLSSAGSASRFAMYRRDTSGERTSLAHAGPVTKATVSLMKGNYELLFGDGLTQPDLMLDSRSTKLARATIPQGTELRLTAVIRNAGGRSAKSATLTAYADRPSPERALSRKTVSIAANSTVSVSMRVPTDRMDGRRRVVLMVRAVEGDLCRANDILALPVEVTPAPSRWTRNALIVVDGGPATDGTEPLIVRVQSQNIEPASVRVWELGHPTPRPCPAQCDALPEGMQLCFLPRTPIQAGSSRRFRVVWNERNAPDPSMFAVPSGRYDPVTRVFRGETYSCRLSDGVIRDVELPRAGGAPTSVISKIMVSSAETGWTEEPGTVRQYSLLADGPVRTIVSVTKQLQAGVRYTKRFTLYRTGFDVEARVTPQVAVTSRAYYLAGGTFADSQGNVAVIDGSGEAEGVVNRGSGVAWYEVRGTDWAHSCIAIRPYGGLTYWDSSEWGGIGFVSPQGPTEVVAYRFYSGPTKPGFASTDHERITSRPTIRFVEGSLSCATSLCLHVSHSSCWRSLLPRRSRASCGVSEGRIATTGSSPSPAITARFRGSSATVSW